VVFSIAELDSAILDSGVIVADTIDGTALSANEGPLRLVAPHEKRPARSGAHAEIDNRCARFAFLGAAASPGVNCNGTFTKRLQCVVVHSSARLDSTRPGQRRLVGCPGGSVS